MADDHVIVRQSITAVLERKSKDIKVFKGIIKKEKFDYNLDVLLWLTFIPDSLFKLSAVSVKYLVDNNDAQKKNAGRLLINEKVQI